MLFYFLQLIALVGPTGPHSIGPIFVHFFVCMGSYLANEMTNVGLQMLNCFWFIGITLFLNGALQKIVRRCQIQASWRPIDVYVFVVKYNRSDQKCNIIPSILLPCLAPTRPHSIRTILVHFFVCLGSYPGNEITNVGLQTLNCLWFIGITKQKIVERCQIAASWRPIYSTISTN